MKKFFRDNQSPQLSFLVLSLIFILGLLLRVVNLSSFPNGFMSDEAYLGYNAYSLLKTARDINGHFLPLFLESFLYTPAGYSYLSIFFIKIFGLSVFSVRFASAFFGALTIFPLYFLTKSVLNLEKNDFLSKQKLEIVALLSAFLLAITPWHLNLSRTASVSTVVTFFIVLGVYFFFKWIETNKTLFIFVSFLFFFVSLFFYIAPFTFLPFLIPLIFLLYRERVNLKNKIFFVILFLIFIIPIIVTYTSPTLSLRISTLSLANNPLVPILLTHNTNQDGVENIRPVVARAFHNKVSVIADLFLGNYFKHFSYDFLFRDSGYPERYKIPEAGLIYPVFLIFILSGIYFSIRLFGLITWMLIGWILLSPVGSGFASDDIPNLQRTLFMLPPLLIFASIGIVAFFIGIKEHKFLSKLSFFVLTAATVYEAFFYMHQYYIHESAYRPWFRSEGYQELINKINKYDKNFKKTVVTNREASPTIFLLFYNQYDPKLIQETIKKSTLRDTDRISFSSYEITQEECPLRMVIDANGTQKLIGDKDVLYINSGLCEIEKYPSEVKKIDTVYRSDGSKVYYLLKIDR